MTGSQTLPEPTLAELHADLLQAERDLAYQRGHYLQTVQAFGRDHADAYVNNAISHVAALKRLIRRRETLA